MGGINPWNLIRSMKSIDEWQQTVNANVVGSAKTGYKQFDVMFGGDVTMTKKPSTASSNGIQLPEQGLVPVNTAIDFSQGEVMASSEWQHLAVAGDGFFMTTSKISAPNPDTEVFYTRDGTFHLDEDGFLRTKEGLYVLDGTQIPGDPNPQTNSIPPWDTSIFADWFKREKLRLKEPDHNLTANTVVEYTFDTGSLYNNGYCQEDLSDIRIGFYNQSTSTWENIPCTVDVDEPNSSTRLRFRLKEDLNVGDDIAGKYYLFYDYQGGTLPPPLGMGTPTLSFDNQDVAKNEFNLFSEDVVSNTQSVISFTNVAGVETWRTGPPDSPSDSWVGIPNKGNIDYVKGTGYVFSQTPAGNNEVYRISNGMGGWMFVDQGGIDPATMEIIPGMEIMMTVIKQTNINPDTMTLLSTVNYDLELTTADMDNYTIFDPMIVYNQYGSVPDLKTVDENGVAVSVPYDPITNGWGPYTYDDGTGMLITISTPYQDGGGLTAGDSNFLPDGTFGANTDVWAGTSAIDNNYNFLTVRQPIYVSMEGLIRDNASINLSGFTDQDVSVYLRTSSGNLVPIYEDNMYKHDVFNGSIDPTLLELGTNYIEVYASKEAISPPNVPAYDNDFSEYSLFSSFQTVGMDDGWQVGGSDPQAWTITDSANGSNNPSMISSYEAIDLPAAFGNVLYGSTNTDNFVYRGDDSWDDYTFSSTIGRSNWDNDTIMVWVRVDETNSSQGPVSGYAFVLQGSGGSYSGGLLDNEDKVALVKASWDGSMSTFVPLATCDPTDPNYSAALKTWNDNNGFISGGAASHWNVKIKVQGDDIKLSLSERGTNSNILTESSPYITEITATDPTNDHPTGKFALKTISQCAWFDNVMFVGATDDSGNPILNAGLRIDDANLNDIQSIESFEYMARYYTVAGKVYDRFGGGTQAENQNPFMTSNADDTIGSPDDENFIDYDPNTAAPLEVDDLDDVPILQGRLVQYTKNPGAETRVQIANTDESPAGTANPYYGSELWTEYQAIFKMGLSDTTATDQKLYSYIREEDSNNWIRLEYDNIARTLKLQKQVNGGSIVTLQTETGFRINEPVNAGAKFQIKAEGERYTIQTLSGTNKTINWQIRDTAATGGGLAPLYGNLAFGNTCSAWYDDLIIEQLGLHKDITTLGEGLVKPDDAEALLAQMNLVLFPVQDGLKYSTKYGSVYFNKTQAAGVSHSEKPGTNGAGYLHSSALEASNVDLAKQLTSLSNSGSVFDIISKQFEIYIGNIDATLNLFR